MERIEFEKEMSWFLNYYDVVLNKTQTTVWFNNFSKLDQTHFNKMLNLHIKTDADPRFPAIGKITMLISKAKTVSGWFPS